MGLAGVLSVFVEKKKEKPWEVVDSKAVEPVPLFDEDDGAYLCIGEGSSALNCDIADIDIIYVHETRVVRNYVFDVRKDKDLENSLLFAQLQFCEEVQRKGYNALWSEGCVLHVLALRICVTNDIMLPQLAANPPPQSQTTSGRNKVHRTACLSHWEASAASSATLPGRSR